MPLQMHNKQLSDSILQMPLQMYMVCMFKQSLHQSTLLACDKALEDLW